MNYTFRAKKLGSFWYLDVEHLDPYTILFNQKICRVFSKIDKNNIGELSIFLDECNTIIEPNTIFIKDEDLLRYFTTTDDFEIRFYIDDHEFSISADMYNLLESLYNTNFHKTLYTIHVLN